MNTRRSFLTALATSAAGSLLARDYGPNAQPERYPDPDVIALHPSFSKCIQGNAPIQRLHAGLLWAEGPAWSTHGNYLMWSDIPNNVQHRWLNEDGHVSIFRNPSNYSNGNTFDYEGRQISCEHGTRRVARYDRDGKVTVLADKFEGKPFNAPNDAVVHPDGGVWFTDPGYGSMGNYEGFKGDLEIKEAVYRIDPGGKIAKVTEDLAKPNGLCFSPDYKKLYIADTGAAKNIRVYDVVDGKKLANGKVFCVMNEDLAPRIKSFVDKLDKQGIKVKVDESGAGGVEIESSKDGKGAQDIVDNAFAELQPFIQFSTRNTEGKVGTDGLRCDVDGNLWCSTGWAGDGFDGVLVLNPEGQRIGQIKLPETGSNLCFGGPRRNRLFITASQSIYSLYVNTQGAHIC